MRSFACVITSRFFGGSPINALGAPPRSIPERAGACTYSPAVVRWVNPAECHAGCPWLRSCAPINNPTVLHLINALPTLIARQGGCSRSSPRVCVLGAMNDEPLIPKPMRRSPLSIALVGAFIFVSAVCGRHLLHTVRFTWVGGQTGLVDFIDISRAICFCVTFRRRLVFRTVHLGFSVHNIGSPRDRRRPTSTANLPTAR